MKIFLWLLIPYFLLIIYVRYLEKTTVFVPSKKLSSTPAECGLPFEDIYFKTEDGILLNGWFIPAKAEDPTLLFMHGNAGNIGDRLEKIKLFHDIPVNVFIFDYRGYGKSEAVASEEGMYNDARAAYEYLLREKRIKTPEIIAYGASLGGAAAVDLASKRPVGGLIVDSSFSRAADMAKRIFPFIPTCFVKTKMDSYSKISNVFAPVLFIHSVQDVTVPISLAEKLYHKANEPKQFIRTNGGHNETYLTDREKFMSGIREFIEKRMLN